MHSTLRTCTYNTSPAQATNCTTFCVRVGDKWGNRSSILRNCDISIAAAIPISQSPILCKSWGRMGISQFHSAQLRYRYRSCDIDIAAAIPISQSPILCKGWGWMGISQFHSAQLRYRYRSFAFCVCVAVEVGAMFCRYVSAGCMLTATLAGTLVLVAC